MLRLMARRVYTHHSCGDGSKVFHTALRIPLPASAKPFSVEEVRRGQESKGKEVWNESIVERSRVPECMSACMKKATRVSDGGSFLSYYYFHTCPPRMGRLHANHGMRAVLHPQPPGNKAQSFMLAHYFACLHQRQLWHLRVCLWKKTELKPKLQKPAWNHNSPEAAGAACCAR